MLVSHSVCISPNAVLPSSSFKQTISRDSKEWLELPSRNGEDEPVLKQIKGIMEASMFAGSVFSVKWGLVIVDEAHMARKVNFLFNGLQMLRKQSNAIVLMTATPATTSPLVSFYRYFSVKDVQSSVFRI